MKKLFTILTIIITAFISAQSLKLTDENFKNSADTTKNFVVIEVPNKSKQEIFISLKKLLNDKFIGMKSESYTEIENEQISVFLYSKNKLTILLNPLVANVYYANVKYEFNFKDGKMMIKPTFQFLTNFEGYKEYLKDIDNRKESKKEKVTNFINSETNNFIDKIKNNLDNEKSSDW